MCPTFHWTYGPHLVYSSSVDDPLNCFQLSLLGMVILWSSVYVYLFKYVCVFQMLSRVWLFATPWTVACQAPLSARFSRQEYWSGLPFPSPGDLPDPGSNLGLLHCRQILTVWSAFCGVCTPNPELLPSFLPSFAIYVSYSNKCNPVSPSADELTFWALFFLVLKWPLL